MFLLLFSFMAMANDAVLSAASSSLDRGQPKIALQLLIKELKVSPNHPDLNLLAGTAYTRIGQYSDALEHFQYSEGALGANNKYSEFYADTLRAYGNGRDAAEIRMGIILVGELPPAADIRLYTAMIDDYRSVGDLQSAYDIFFLMESQFPNAIFTNLMGAELALDEMKLDEAQGYISMIEDSRKLWRYNSVKARLAYLEQRYQSAYDLSYRFGRARMPSHGVSIRLESARMANDPIETFLVLNRNTWKDHEGPEFLLSLMLAHADIGEYFDALEVGDYLKAIYPMNFGYVEAVESLQEQIEQKLSSTAK